MIPVLRAGERLGLRYISYHIPRCLAGPVCSRLLVQCGVRSAHRWQQTPSFGIWWLARQSVSEMSLGKLVCCVARYHPSRRHNGLAPRQASTPACPWMDYVGDGLALHGDDIQHNRRRSVTKDAYLATVQSRMCDGSRYVFTFGHHRCHRSCPIRTCSLRQQPSTGCASVFSEPAHRVSGLHWSKAPTRAEGTLDEVVAASKPAHTGAQFTVRREPRAFAYGTTGGRKVSSPHLFRRLQRNPAKHATVIDGSCIPHL